MMAETEPGIQIGVAMVLESDDPAQVRLTESRLLEAMEMRRRVESRRRGRPHYLRCRGFERSPGKLEIRGELYPDVGPLAWTEYLPDGSKTCRALPALVSVQGE